MKTLITVLFCVGRVWAAEDVDAKAVLGKVVGAYSHLKSLHVVAERDSLVFIGPRTSEESSVWELAEAGQGRYFASLKIGHEEAVALSDGNSSWKAWISRKQWNQISAASVPDDEEEGSKASQKAPDDFRGFVTKNLVHQYVAIAQKAESAEILKEESVKVGREKIPCYLIHVSIGKDTHDLWVDKERYLVLQYRQKGQTPEGYRAEAVTKTKLIDLNGDIAAAKFQFTAGAGWSEVDMLALPGEHGLDFKGSRAVDFKLKSLLGDVVELDRLKGKVVVLDFWATWCGPCRAEMPSVEKLRGEFGDKVAFYGVADEEAGTVRRFLEKNHYELPVLMDVSEDVHRKYSVRAIPTMFVIDREGVVRQHFIGSRGEEALRKAIEGVVAGR